MKKRLLKVKKNQFSKIQDLILEQLDVEFLEIITDGLESFPDIFNQFTHLKKIILNCKGLLEIPNSIFMIKELTYLKIINTSVANIEVKNLCSTDLTDIIINKNKLELIPSFIEQCTSLQTLSLSSNNISEINISFKNLKKLRRLNIDHNSLKEVFFDIANLENLNHISCDGNPLTEEEKNLFQQKFNIWF